MGGLCFGDLQGDGTGVSEGEDLEGVPLLGVMEAWEALTHTEKA
jgi:hypothetical protein